MSNDYILPPVPEWTYEEVRENQVKAYGHACAEAARAPLVEENARLKEQVQRLLERLEIESEDDPVDGIFCRNTTIRELDQVRDAVAKQRDEALARIAELERSVDELAAAVGWTKERCDQDGDAPVDVADRLRAEVEKCRSDAERYTCLKSMAKIGITKRQEFVITLDLVPCPNHIGELDLALDDARLGEGD